MSVPYYGDFAEDDTVNLPFNTFSSNDPAASVTATDLADTDIYVHKDGSATALTTDGATIDIDAPGVGAHMITIDTSAHADYSTGSEYAVRVDGVTVDSGTINAWIGAFSIERANGALAVAKTIKTETAAIVADTGTDGVVLAADAITAAKIADNAIATEHIATAAITADSIAADAIGASELAADAATEIGNAVWDTDATGRQTAGTFGQAIGDPAANAETIYKAVVTDADGTNIAADIIVVDGNVDDIELDTAEIGTAGALLTDLGGMSTGMKEEVNVQALDVLATDTHAEASGVVAATASLKDSIVWLKTLARNKLTQTATAQVLRNDGDSGDVATSTLADDGTTFSRGKFS